jgi:hypothetical protein
MQKRTFCAEKFLRYIEYILGGLLHAAADRQNIA